MKLTDSKFTNTEFFSCKMNGIDWCMCNWKSLLNPLPLKFTECILDDSNFFGLEMQYVVMKMCRAKKGYFDTEVQNTTRFLIIA
mgnify:FL=1